MVENKINQESKNKKSIQLLDFQIFLFSGNEGLHPRVLTAHRTPYPLLILAISLNFKRLGIILLSQLLVSQSKKALFKHIPVYEATIDYASKQKSDYD